MALLHISDREIRAPEAEVLPDGRKRLTRYLTIPNKLEVPADLNVAFGTADKFSGAPAGWAGLRLTNKKLTDDLPPPGKTESRPVLVLVYEQIDATAETAVGADDISYDESGFKNVAAEYIQFTAGTYVPGTVGVTTYGPDGSCVLKDVTEEDDGTVRRIKRTFINGGTLSDETQLKNGGKLQIRTIKTVKTAPATPGGFVLIGNPVQNPGGLPVYTYTFAQGDGEISRQTDYVQSPDQGTTGLTRTTIVTLTAPGTSITPASLGGFSLATSKYDDADGYRIWTTVFAKGVGVAVTSVEIKEGGKLIVYHRISFAIDGVTPPAAPSATIGGTVVLISDALKIDSGHYIYDYTWAEGNGEVLRSTEYRLSADSGATGMTITTIKYLSALSVGSNPITPPGGFATVQESHEDADGHRIWTGIYATGTGTVVSSTELKNNGKLAIYTAVALNTPPSAPASTIGGTVVAIRTEDKRDRFHEGVVVYDYMWAEGSGTIVTDVDKRHNGKLVLYHRIALGAAPTAPTATIGGTVVLVDDDSREESGVTVYDRKWAEGKGVIHQSTQPHDGGLRTETWVSLGATYDVAFMLPVGVLVLKDSDELDGAKRWTVTCMQWADGTNPIGAGPLQYEAWVPFRYPGQATLFSENIGGGFATVTCVDMFLSPPIEALVLATHKISYQTSNAVGSLSAALWNPTQYATLRAKFANTAGPRSIVRGLEGYASGTTSTATGTDGGGGTISVLGERLYGGSAFSASISGGPTMPTGSASYTLHAITEPAFIGFDGTQYYRKILIVATPPALPALPV